MIFRTEKVYVWSWMWPTETIFFALAAHLRGYWSASQDPRNSGTCKSVIRSTLGTGHPGTVMGIWWFAMWNEQMNILTKRRVQSSSVAHHVWRFVTPWTAACQASLSITSSQSLLKLMSIMSVMPSKRESLKSRQSSGVSSLGTSFVRNWPTWHAHL